MEGTLDFDSFNIGANFSPLLCYTMSLNLCKNLRKYPFRDFKGMRMFNFYIINALGQNLAISESCLILRFL